MLAWHHYHLVYQSRAKHKVSITENATSGWRVPTVSLATSFPRSKRWCSTNRLLVRASSLVNGNALPAFSQQLQGQITQEAVNLLMFSHIIGVTKAATPRQGSIDS